MAMHPLSVYRNLLLGVMPLLLALLMVGCATPSVAPFEPSEPEEASAARTDGAFAEVEAYLSAAHGGEVSGFTLLDSNEDALRWRLALIDSARHTIDLQYYLWYGDTAGRLLAARILEAADRGVKVRALVDDLNTLLRDASSVTLRDKVVAWLDAHPNIELRLFNPWSKRDFGGRIGEGLTNFKRANIRMHNKALIVDNRAVIIGGRNIGDEYMGLNSSFNFHDLDVLGVGPVARQTSAVFDTYWNSEWVLPVAALNIEIPPDEQSRARTELMRNLAATKALANFEIEPQSWDELIADLKGQLSQGSSRVISDLPRKSAIDHLMLEEIKTLINSPEQELLIVNAYIIPRDRSINTLNSLNADGVEVKILTNSLASHDVPAVNSHYRPWRKRIISTGAELYELRSDAAIQSEVCDTRPTVGEFVGLHSKALVVDRRLIYVGSMNFDPRSAALNTEMGVIIDSLALGEELAALIERDISSANSWRVSFGRDGKLQWAHDSEVTTKQPARNFWQRVQELFFRSTPKEYY